MSKTVNDLCLINRPLNNFVWLLCSNVKKTVNLISVECLAGSLKALVMITVGAARTSGV